MDAIEYLEKKRSIERTPFEFTDVEQKLAFPLHKDLTDFYEIVSEDAVFGVLSFHQIDQTGKWGHWFDSDADELIGISLYGTKGYIPEPLVWPDGSTYEEEDEEEDQDYNFEEDLLSSFYCYCYKNSEYEHVGFGRKMILGDLQDNNDRDGFVILFDNDTGYVEWFDTEWGNHNNITASPHGILAKSLDELMNLMKECSKKTGEI